MNSKHKNAARAARPPWLIRRAPSGSQQEKTRQVLRRAHLHTVCEAARCPNLGECFSRKSATFLILGDRCTRNCRFCSIDNGPLDPPDPHEPQKVAEAAHALGLGYVVVTSVTRDDLVDGGAGQFARTIRAVRRRTPGAPVEVLVPDFSGSRSAVETVVAARPDVLNHNLETIPRLYAKVRPGADYRRSLELLSRVRELDAAIPTKSGLMLGLGETTEEVEQVFFDLLQVGCRALTIGQYLQPSAGQLPVERYAPPETFEQLKHTALEMGFLQVASSPFVRSSYRAKRLFEGLASSRPGRARTR